MIQKFYISELHLGHKNCLSFDARPFETLEEMTETIISRWDYAVDEKDEVYILGDMFWKNAETVDILSRLNGQLHLVKGNHGALPLSHSTLAEFRLWLYPSLRAYTHGA